MRWWLRRPRVIIPVAVAALVLVATGVRYLLDDGMSGPSGPFPRPVATQAPAGVPQLVATTPEGPGRMQIYGGVAINGALKFFGGRGDAVRAVGIATGRTYWKYKQKHAQPIGLDRTTGDVYVDGRHDLVKINVRTGRIRWSRPTPGYFPNEHAIVSGTGTLVIFDDYGSGGDMTGIDPVTGRTRWTSAHSCDKVKRTTVVVGGTLAMACGLADDVVRGVDLATGKQRWQQEQSSDFSVLDDGQGHVAVSAKDGFDLLDPATGKVLRHHLTKGEVTVAFSDGMRLSACALGKSRGMCGSDADTGERLWSSAFPGHPAGYVPGDPGNRAYATVADGRVYSLSAIDTPQREVDQIVVFDLRTGRRLADWSLDGLTMSQVPLTIADGVLAVHKDDVAGAVGLYADRPDLHRTRHLFFQ
ncbi:PQQ-binding-like beta-propeller repeat protein [Actinoallomurus vinaceus]|uniref:outer membrane protein assembly factor BamB family protein n=1 Tax=Actinoallomurus vinaceus TaxID=1080074 RepID=UPI0031F091D9